jgi:hypothetical protein
VPDVEALRQELRRAARDLRAGRVDRDAAGDDLRSEPAERLERGGLRGAAYGLIPPSVMLVSELTVFT